MNCTEFEQNVPAFLYRDLPPDAQAAMEGHQEECAACRQKIEETRKVQDLLNGRPNPGPSAEFLSQCRRALEEAVDRVLEKVTWRGLLREFLTGFTAVPATRAAGVMTLLVLGFGLGWTLRPVARSTGGALSGSVPPLNAADLTDFHINGISQVERDPETGGVKITVDAERRVTLKGSLDNPRIRGILIDAVKTYDNPGIRRDTLDALRPAGDDPGVRSALLYALDHDPNVGLRLDALESIRGVEWCPEIQQAVLDALRHDKNPGVRVEAVDVLTQHATSQILPVLNQLATNDPNPYVRLKCIKAVRQVRGNEN